jgi:hypothetical protein
LAVDGSELWVADPDHARIVGLIPGRPPQVVAVGGRPDTLATDPGGRVWVTNASTTRVTVFDHSAGRPEQLPVGSETGAISISPHAAWVATRGRSSVTRIDLGSRSHTTIALSARPTAIVAAFNRIWIALDDDSVTVLNDDGSPSRVAFAPLPGAAVAGAASDGVWFVTALAGGTAKLTRINPKIDLARVTNGRLQYAEPPGQPSLAGRPADLAAGQHTLAVGVSDRLSLIGTSGGQDGRTLGTVRFGSAVGRLALSSGVVWAGLPASGRVFKIAF